MRVVDPVRGGLNWYAYCSNNPVNYVDPTGLEAFSDLTESEQQYVRDNPIKAILTLRRNKNKAEQAVDYTSDAFPGSGHNDDVDALRHAYFSALNNKSFGEEEARQIGINHEDVPIDDQPEAEREMDLYNNEVGIQVGLENPKASKNELWAAVVEAYDEGKLQLSPDTKAVNPIDAEEQECDS